MTVRSSEWTSPQILVTLLAMAASTFVAWGVMWQRVNDLESKVTTLSEVPAQLAEIRADIRVIRAREERRGDDL